MGLSSTTDDNVEVGFDSDPYLGISYIYNSFDLYSQLYDDTYWSRQGSDLTTDSGRKNIVSQVQSNVRSKRKTIIEKSHISADKVNNAKESSGDKAEQQHATKHGAIREAAPTLHVVDEETEIYGKSLSASNTGNTSDTPERGFSSLNEPEVIKHNYCRFFYSFCFRVFCESTTTPHFYNYTKK